MPSTHDSLAGRPIAARRPAKAATAGRSRQRLRCASLFATLALAAFLACPLGVFADEGDKDEKKPGDAPAKGEPAKKEDAKAKSAKRKAILPLIEKDPKLFRSLVDAARQYFDLDEEQWKGRTALVGELEVHAAEGRYFLKDMQALRWMVYEGRSFEPPLSDRKWQKAVGISEAKGLGGTLSWIKSEDLNVVYSVPRKYPKPKDFRSKYPRIDPLPLLLTMHEKKDFAGQKIAGEALLKRRYPKKAWGDLYEQWLMLCPTAAAGNYLAKSGMVRELVFKNPFADFWRHYHVDFDRVVLDGTQQAFAVATSMPVFFAGVVFNGKWTLKDSQKELVKNLAPVPVYVVNNPALAKQLRESGHNQVTAGVGGATLMKWLGERRRVLPKKFSWTVQPMRFDLVLPYWINLDSPNWSAPKRQIDVEVLDTEKAPNTIRITSIGINTLSLFLNDEVIDLDRPLRVEINGHVEFDGVVPLQDPRMEKVGRDFDFLFNRDPVRIRTSMFFGWLSPARIVSLNVRAPRKIEPKKDDKKAEAPKASPDDVARAARFLQKSKVYAGKGNWEKALEWIEKVLELPETPHHGDARALKKDVEEKMKKPVKADGK